VQTESPYWLQEAYREPINLPDTGILDRNLRFARLTAPLLFTHFDRHGRYLDYAGGYGIFTRLMRDVGFDYYWHDPFTTNLLARGFEYRSDMAPLEALTAFETFEHFEHPAAEIEKMLSLSRTIIFSTLLLPDPIPGPEEWWYYGVEHGQHIALYSLQTLKLVASRNALNLLTNGTDFHMLTDHRVSPFFFRHLALLSKRGLFALVKSRMRSRMVDDRDSLVRLMESRSPGA